MQAILSKMKTLLFIIALVTTFAGRVVDQKGEPIAYATVYPEIAPEWGTATNNDGYFSFEANLTKDSRVVVSYIGYQKQVVLAGSLENPSLPNIVLIEQPIALEETVVAAKKSKQRNKNKQMAALLHAVYVQLERDFPDDNAQYQVVSDVREILVPFLFGVVDADAHVEPEVLPLAEGHVLGDVA